MSDSRLGSNLEEIDAERRLILARLEQGFYDTQGDLLFEAGPAPSRARLACLVRSKVGGMPKTSLAQWLPSFTCLVWALPGMFAGWTV